MKEIEIYQHHFLLLPSGAIFWREAQTLLIADAHLGKVAHFRKNGVAVPRKAEGAFYQKTEGLLRKYSPQRILFLGDLFHSFQNNEWHLFEGWVKQQTAQMILVEGNHDVIPAYKFTQLGLTVINNLTEGAFHFTHIPVKKEDYFVICGHIHPGVKLKGVGLQQMKVPCFYQSDRQLILPAFGAFTGIHVLTPKEGDRVFVCTKKEVVPIKNKVDLN